MTGQLDKIKRRLGIALDHGEEDDLLRDLVGDAKAYFLGLAGQDEADYKSKYDYIIENVVYKLYQRKGSEAIRQESVDGYTVVYDDWDSFFKPYLKIIERDFGEQSSYRKQGRATFL